MSDNKMIERDRRVMNGFQGASNRKHAVFSITIIRAVK